MKLIYSFEFVDMGDEIVAVPVGIGADSLHGVLKVNAEGKEILDLLQSDISEQTIIEKLSSKYTNHSQIEQYTHSFVAKLFEMQLLKA